MLNVSRFRNRKYTEDIVAFEFRSVLAVVQKNYSSFMKTIHYFTIV